MILYFSGTGNSAYVAEKIKNKTEDEMINLFERIRNHDCSEIHSDKPWVIVAPTYAWRMPRILKEWLAEAKLTGSRDIYFVLTCGGSIGDAESYARKLSKTKGMSFRGCMPVVMPENYIAMFTSPTSEEAVKIIQRAEKAVEKAVLLIKRKETYTASDITIKDKINSGIVNDLFYPAFVHAKKFYADESCISCGKCEKLCPLGNIKLENGRPVWGKNCTHCMACICRCPKEAIEYGRHTKGLVRYKFPQID